MASPKAPRALLTVGNPKAICRGSPRASSGKGKTNLELLEGSAALAPPCASHSWDTPGLSTTRGSQKQWGFTGDWQGWENPHGGKVAARGDISFQSAEPALIGHLIPGVNSKTLPFYPFLSIQGNWVVHAVLGETPGANCAWKRFFCRWLLPELSTCSGWDELSGHCTISGHSGIFSCLVTPCHLCQCWGPSTHLAPLPTSFLHRKTQTPPPHPGHNLV